MFIVLEEIFSFSFLICLLRHGNMYNHIIRMPSSIHQSNPFFLSICDMMINHAVFSKEIPKILPKKETIYITILRNPVDEYRSLYRYFKDAVPSFKNTANSIEGFKDPPLRVI